jgi:predicted transcriptional regulator
VSTSLTVRGINAELRGKLDALAAKHDRSVSYFVRIAIERFLREVEAERFLREVEAEEGQA